AYFAHCDRIIAMAAAHGMVVFLDPAETNGFLGEMRANGVEKCRAYGRYLGRRYRDADNIIWLSGDSFAAWKDSANDAVVTAVALGIKDTDDRHLHTVELGEANG